MAFDDEDPTSAAPQVSGADATEEVPTAEDDAEDEVQDFRKFATALQKTQVSSSRIRKGEKDFESHGTRLQENYLEASRQAMHETLSYSRAHNPSQYLRGWYFPEHWTQGDETEEDDGGLLKRQRVVVVETDRGAMTKTTGRVLKGVSKNTPAWDKLWLLPEEALYLIERGDMQLWWPERGIEDIFPVGSPSAQDLSDFGLPLSFQAAYALLIGENGKQGKINLQHYQVYANLRRSGYLVFRAPSKPPPASQPPGYSSRTIWQWLIALLSTDETSRPSQHPPFGPLVRPGLYRSYQPVFRQLELIQRHKPSLAANTNVEPEAPFRIFFHVYKSRPGFTKAHLPPPDFRIAVVDARVSSVPSLSQISALLDSTPSEPPDEKLAAGRGIGFMYRRLKHGWRNAIMAVVDRGFISYIRFTEMAFGEERVYEGFDGPSNRGGKKGRKPQGGRGGRGGRRGGRGGRGGGRGG
ncbi:tRNA-splicing endonuclease subunit sen54 N-term-domain-containing protein [Xylariales sp. PMI_506]|nr:tRNA-splicing endonuclease subunit sen54 N-term-domain-containing protein [Xylariales sp. PMI_506]